MYNYIIFRLTALERNLYGLRAKSIVADSFHGGKQWYLVLLEGSKTDTAMHMLLPHGFVEKHFPLLLEEYTGL